MCASTALPTSAAQADAHLRGVILGTTPASIDVGLADRSDVHLEMQREPQVAIAERASLRAVRTGAYVSVLTVRDGSRERVRAITVVPHALQAFTGFANGRQAWDYPAGRSALVNGRVLRRTDARAGSALAIDVGRGAQRIVVPSDVRVVALRRGSRRALRSPQSVFIFTGPPVGGVSERARWIVVADGAFVLPF